MIIAYQKEKPQFLKWIKAGDDGAMDAFREKFIALAQDYSARFVGSLFRKSKGYEFSKLLPHNKGKSTLDLVLQTLGYHAKNDLPGLPEDKWYANKVERDIETQWGIDAINARKCWEITKGTDTVVAILDSGIDPYNSFFKGRTLPGFSFLKRTTPPWSDEDPPTIDYGLHGTGVSSALLAIAPECKIMPVRVHDAETMNDPPYGYWLRELLAAGIYCAVNQGAHIISVSAAIHGSEPVMAEAVRYAYEKNVIICSSAGNISRVQFGLDPDSSLYRAVDKEVLLIGGVEKRDTKIRPWPYSVPGEFVDVAAPSSEVFILVPVYMENMQNMYVPGTSLSAPIAAGVAALMRSAAPPPDSLLQNPGEYVRLVTHCLKETARLEILGMAEPNEFVGYGLIDALAAVKMIQQSIQGK